MNERNNDSPRRKPKQSSENKPERKIRPKLRVRVPIAIPKGRKASFLSIARFSKEEQRKQSNPAQHRFNRSNINENVENRNQCEWEEVSDAAISGELRNRPGIDYVREGIARRKWELIVAEDSSRIFRNLLFCLELVSAAVDKKIRIICINDDVDTAEPGWKERLQEAQKHHCQDNKYTRNRLERTIEDLWEDGAAVGHLRSGYDRIPSVPATAREPAEGPFFDKISKKWKPKCQVARAIRMGQAMEAAGISDPYIRLTSLPETVSRWRTEGRRKKPQKKAG